MQNQNLKENLFLFFQKGRQERVEIESQDPKFQFI